MLLALLILASDPLPSIPALRNALREAKPGDRITLAPGVHEGALYFEDLRGEPGRPITIAGADPARPSVIRGGGNCIHLVAPAHVVIEHLVLERATGNAINIDDGGRGGAQAPAPGVTLRDLHVRDIGGDGNHDGIKLSGLTGFLIERCTVERWGRDGSGIDMVGCRDGVIRGCTLRHSDTGGAHGVQAKGGSRDITICACRFEHAGRRALNLGGSTGLQFFRPPLDQWPAETRFEAAALVVEGCTIIGSEAAVAFVGIDGADVRFNTIYHPARWPLRILQETTAAGFVPSRNARFTDNLIVCTDPGRPAVNIGPHTDAPSFTFARNVWYYEDDPRGSARPALPSTETGGTYGQNPRLRDPANGDLTPAPDGPAAHAGAHALK